MTFRKTRTILFAILVATAATVGLGKSPDSIGVPEARWTTSTLRTCWQSDLLRLKADAPFWTGSNARAEIPSAKAQAEVAAWARAAYSISRVGLEFTGFSECPSGEEALASYPVYLVGNILLTGDSSGVFGISEIGDQNQYAPKRRKLVLAKNSSWPKIAIPRFRREGGPLKAAVGFDFNSADENGINYIRRVQKGIESMHGLDWLTQRPEGEFQNLIREQAKKESFALQIEERKISVLHELGHLAGLLHEDNRDDAAAQRPAFCIEIAAGTQGSEKTFPLKTSRFGTEYDPFSIMSYCGMTTHRLFHQAKLVCRLSPHFSENVRRSISDFLAECPTVETLEYPVDLSERDVNAIRQLYLGESPGTGSKRDYRESERERTLMKVLWLTARLPFDSLMTRELKLRETN